MLLQGLFIYNFGLISHFIAFLMIIPSLIRLIVVFSRVTNISMCFSLCRSLLEDYEFLNDLS